MSAEKPPDNCQIAINQTVTAVGNSWIICRSKSHSGRIYYFNTFTGESAWNLSDTEIEKAKLTTKILESQPGNKLEGWPEPKEPPVEHNNHSNCKNNPQQQSPTFVPPRIYNKQIINNQYSKPPPYVFPPILNSQCTKCSTVTKDPPLGVNITPANALNPNIWTIPPNHQIVIAPTQSPIMNQPQSPVNVAYNSLEQPFSMLDTPVPLSKRFTIVTGSRFNNDNFKFNHRSRFNSRNIFKQRNNFNPRNQNPSYYKNFNRPSTSNDLRQVLSSKRNNGWENRQNTPNQENVSNYYNTETRNVQSSSLNTKIQIIKPALKDFHRSDADDAWIKEHASVQGTHLILNVTPLKNIVFTGKNSNWFIVADVNVLLNHFNLITIVVNSDAQCQLMVPDHTMAELQASSRSDDPQIMNQAHYVLKLLTQQLSSGCAVLGKDPSTGAQNSNILEFSEKLSEQNYDVVLVSDITWHNNGNKIPIFTIQEVKGIIENKYHDSKQYINQPYGVKTNNSLQITIANNLNNEESCNQRSPDQQAPPRRQNLQEDYNEFCHESKKMRTERISETDTVDHPKITIEAEAQTALILVKNNNPTETLQKTLNDTKPETFSSFQTSTSTVNQNVNEVPKKREIRLKRNISHQSNATNESCEDKKQFKWRRRKIKLSLKNSSCKENTVQQTEQAISNFRTTPVNEKKDQQTSLSFSDEHDDIDKNFKYQESHGNDYDYFVDNMNGSETTSSSYIIQKNARDNIVIEETSTSDIISNTGSRGDSNSVFSTKQYINYADNLEKSMNKCVMFEIETEAMEDSLSLKSDEWVSRFVQIMEEILTQILQQAPTFVNRTMPPPWTLHEATECIRKKFNEDQDVIDASDKLTNILYRISDTSGKIKEDIKPTDFMEMYSYGVYLIDSLQSSLGDSEDVQIAADMLAKLLSDIQETEVSQDSFNNIEDPSANVTMSSSTGSTQKDGPTIDANSQHCQEEPQKVTSVSDSKTETRKYNLRSARNSSVESKEKFENIKFIRKIDKDFDFFSSLHLKRNVENFNHSTKIDNFESDQTKLSSGLKDTNVPPLIPSEESKSNEKNEPQLQKSPKITNEPKIIRKFGRCLEIEKKLELRRLQNEQSMKNEETLKKLLENELRLKNKKREELNMDKLDYSSDEQACDHFEEEYDSEYDYYPNDEIISDDVFEKETVGKHGKEHDLANVDNNCNYNVQWIVKRIMKEIREVFLQANTFCDRIREEVISSETLSPERKVQIKQQVKKARQHMDCLCNSLNSILSREDNECRDNIQTVLKEAGIHLDAEQSGEYRNIIAKCSEQANGVLESVDVLVEAIK